MSHKFKQKTARFQEEKNDRQIREFARRLRSQAELEKLLDGCSPIERVAFIQKLKPYLSFEIFDTSPTPDCPHCGMRRGSIVQHACVSAEAAREMSPPTQ